jgi:hypothetical protein
MRRMAIANLVLGAQRPHSFARAKCSHELPSALLYQSMPSVKSA